MDRNLWAQHRIEMIEKHASGVMVCIYLPLDVARWLAIEGGEPAEDMHVTLAYIPGVGGNQESFDAIKAAVQGVSERFRSIKGFIGGAGRFNGSETSDYQDVYYASYDSPEVGFLREMVCEALEEAGFELSNKHGFTPHVTLKYLSPSEGIPLNRPSSSEFEVMALSVASRSFRADLPFTGRPIADVDKGQPDSASVHVPTAGEEQKLKVAKEDDDLAVAIAAISAESESRLVPISKIDAQKQIVYAVVLAPDEIDQQEDCMSCEEIEKTAHLYLQRSRVVGRRHTGVIADAFPVESYIAPQDLKFEGGPYGPELVKKGSWVLGVKIPSKTDWQKVLDGEYTAFSIGGMGLRD